MPWVWWVYHVTDHTLTSLPRVGLHAQSQSGRVQGYMRVDMHSGASPPQGGDAVLILTVWRCTKITWRRRRRWWWWCSEDDGDLRQRNKNVTSKCDHKSTRTNTLICFVLSYLVFLPCLDSEQQLYLFFILILFFIYFLKSFLLFVFYLILYFISIVDCSVSCFIDTWIPLGINKISIVIYNNNNN